MDDQSEMITGKRKGKGGGKREWREGEGEGEALIKDIQEEDRGDDAMANSSKQ